MSMISNEASVIDEGAFSVRRTIASPLPSRRSGRPSPSPSTSPGGSGGRRSTARGWAPAGTLTFPDYGAVPLRIEAMDAPRTRVVPMGQR